jgi:hypothetical protein
MPGLLDALHQTRSVTATQSTTTSRLIRSQRLTQQPPNLQRFLGIQGDDEHTLAPARQKPEPR